MYKSRILLGMSLVIGLGALLVAVPTRAQGNRILVPRPLGFPIRLNLATPWRLSMDAVQVERMREGDGDRPYFVALKFQSQLFTRNSTRTELVQCEPHDWVSRAEYRRTGRVGPGRITLVNGERLPVPEWMGHFDWDPVAVVEPNAAGNAHLMGVLILALDNNNTPPHAIRGVAEQFQIWLQRFLREQVEMGRIAGAINLRDGTVNEAALQQRFEEFGRNIIRELDVGKVLETGFQLTVGSTFSPDKLVGVHALILPAVRGIPMVERSGEFSAPLIGERVNWNLLVSTPTQINRDLAFQGSGARYIVPIRLSNSGLSPTAAMSELQLRIFTGDDDLRRNSIARAYVTLRDGRRGPTAELNRGAGWGGYSVNRASVPLPRDSRTGDVRSVTLTFQGGSTGPFDTADNWNVNAVAVYGQGTVMKVARGRPLVRFTEKDKQYVIPLQ
jgi:hypothetical protein